MPSIRMWRISPRSPIRIFTSVSRVVSAAEGRRSLIACKLGSAITCHTGSAGVSPCVVPSGFQVVRHIQTDRTPQEVSTYTRVSPHRPAAEAHGQTEVHLGDGQRRDTDAGSWRDGCG